MALVTTSCSETISAPKAAAPSFPLSAMQGAFYVLSQDATASAAYTIGEALKVRGPLDRSALQRAVDIVVDRHPALRTVYQVGQEGVHQTVLPDVQVVVEWRDARGTSERLLEELVGVIEAPFDLLSFAKPSDNLPI